MAPTFWAGFILAILSAGAMVSSGFREFMKPLITGFTWILVAASLLSTCAIYAQATFLMDTPNPYERYLFFHIWFFGPYSYVYISFLLCVLIPQLLRWQKIRNCAIGTLVIALATMLPSGLDHATGWWARLH